jgi:hypothetical protein
LFGEIAKDVDGEFVMGPLKYVGRVIEKIDLEYSGEVLRASNTLKDTLTSAYQQIDVLMSLNESLRTIQSEKQLSEMKKNISDCNDKLQTFEPKSEEKNG